MSVWIECPKCEGTGINPDAPLIEPPSAEMSVVWWDGMDNRRG